jgi:hypothetical protein
MSGDASDGSRKGSHRNGKTKVFLRRTVDNARQMMQPGPFRIRESLDLVTVSKDMLPSQEGTPAAKPIGDGMDADLKSLLRTIAVVATALWRIRAKLAAQPVVELPSELRHLPRHIQAAWDALTSGDIEIQDPRGQRYVPGMAVNPVTYSPEPSVLPNTIIETLKPAVFWRGALIQRADVILASPADETASHTDPVAPSPWPPNATQQMNGKPDSPMQSTSQEETIG